MKENNYNLGLVSVSFRQHSPREILEAVRAAGLSCIEWGSDVHAPCNDIKRLCEIAALQNEYGIFCSSYGTYFRLGETPTDELEAYIKAARLLGTNVLRLWCAGKSGENMTDGERGCLLNACKKASEIAENNNAILCMECHKGTFTESPDDAVWLMETINSPHFRMYWQPFQWQSADENTNNAAKIANYAEHIHVFNWREEEKLPLAEGFADWQSYLKQFSKPRTLLLEFMPDNKISTLSREAKALRLIIGDLS